MVEHNHWDTDDEIDNFESSPNNSIQHFNARDLVRVSDETIAKFLEMGFAIETIHKAIEETGGDNSELILETLFRYSTSSEASSSKSKVVDRLIGMGFAEELVTKAIQEYGNNIEYLSLFLFFKWCCSGLVLISSFVICKGEENEDDITNALLSYAEAEKICGTKNVDTNNHELSLSSSDEEEELNSTYEDDRLQALIKMDYPPEEASIAIERCGENATVAEVVDFIFAAQMARQLDDFYAEEEPIIDNRERRAYTEQPRRVRNPNTRRDEDEDDLIRLPNPMIGFGVPNEPGLLTHRPVPITQCALGPPYFYYENVAMAPAGAWAQISRHLYDIKPEFVDSIFFCATARKRGYIHNLPINNRFQLQPPAERTIHEAFPSTKKWWPSWDKRTQFNCLLGSKGSAQLTSKIRKDLERHRNGTPPLDVQSKIMFQCRKWNLVWVGKNKVAPLEAYEMEKLLGFPKDHTRGGGISMTNRYKSLGSTFQVDTVAYHLSVLKPLFPKGLNVLSLFTGIGGGEVALHRLKIPMNVVVSVEISETNRNILKSFWEQTNQKGVLREFSDVQKLDKDMIENLMDHYGGFDLVIGGSPCNNLSGANRISRNGLQGTQSSLFYDYCRILETVRDKAARTRRIT
ncbi:unnamed protein product [Cochlearia groenlandica]